MVAAELLKLAMETEDGRKERLKKMVGNHLASYPGPFTRAVRAGREIRAWYQSFAHALNFTGILVK